jgi:hypothetical protein
MSETRSEQEYFMANRLTRADLLGRMAVPPGADATGEMSDAARSDDPDATLPFRRAETEIVPDFVRSLSLHARRLRTFEGEELLFYLAEAISRAESGPRFRAAPSGAGSDPQHEGKSGRLLASAPLAIPADPEILYLGVEPRVVITLSPDLAVVHAALHPSPLDRDSRTRRLSGDLGRKLFNVALHRAVDLGEPDPLDRGLGR